MPVLPIGAAVSLKPGVLVGMNLPCSAAADLYIAVHPGALKVQAVTLTVVVERAGNDVVWVGALDESMLERRAAPAWPQARQALCDRVGMGAQLWEIRYPGPLLKAGADSGMVYRGNRPWLIIGKLVNGLPLAVPFNSITATATNKPYNMFLDKSWYVITPSDTDMRLLPGDTNSTAELPHIWSLPAGLVNCGHVLPQHTAGLMNSLNIYYPASIGPR